MLFSVHHGVVRTLRRAYMIRVIDITTKAPIEANTQSSVCIVDILELIQTNHPFCATLLVPASPVSRRVVDWKVRPSGPSIRSQARRKAGVPVALPPVASVCIYDSDVMHGTIDQNTHVVLPTKLHVDHGKSPLVCRTIFFI